MTGVTEPVNLSFVLESYPCIVEELNEKASTTAGRSDDETNGLIGQVYHIGV